MNVITPNNPPGDGAIEVLLKGNPLRIVALTAFGANNAGAANDMMVSVQPVGSPNEFVSYGCTVPNTSDRRLEAAIGLDRFQAAAAIAGQNAQCPLPDVYWRGENILRISFSDPTGTQISQCAIAYTDD